MEENTTTSPYRTPVNEMENDKSSKKEDNKKYPGNIDKAEFTLDEGPIMKEIDSKLNFDDLNKELNKYISAGETKKDILERILLKVLEEKLHEEKNNKFQTGLTFDDVLLVPQYSDINSRSEVDISTRFSKNVKLNIPFVSSPMDTVTEAEMAIEMARNGGIGIIHRFMSIEDQVEQIHKVKKKEAHIITNPYSVDEKDTVKHVRDLSKQLGVSTFLVVEEKKNGAAQYKKILKGWTRENLLGIITDRDLRTEVEPSTLVKDIMTPMERLHYRYIEDFLKENDYPTPEEVRSLMLKHKVEKIPLITKKNLILGLVFRHDVERMFERPLANLDQMGRLIVGAAVGAKEDCVERTKALVKAGVDVIVVDIANGHSQLCIDTVKKIKSEFPDIDVVAGSVATGEGAEKLIEAGADGIRCGIGNGAICITRVVAGAGVPQLSALLSVAPVCKKYNVPLTSDGGNRNSGNMCKALGAGADCIMLGRLVAGCEESPSKAFYRDGKLVKIYRGMAGYGANMAKAQRTGVDEPETKKFTPEGVEGYIPYAGCLKDVINQFISGIRSGMSYTGARTINEHKSKAKFIRMTKSGERESGVHDINKIS